MLLRIVSSWLLLACLVACSKEPVPEESDEPAARTEPTRDPAGDPPTAEDPEEDKGAADATGAQDEPCPDIVRPAPGFCPDGEIVRREKDGCLRGYDCVTP